MKTPILNPQNLFVSTPLLLLQHHCSAMQSCSAQVQGMNSVGGEFIIITFFYMIGLAHSRHRLESLDNLIYWEIDLVIAS